MMIAIEPTGVGEREVPPVADDDVIEHRNPEKLPRCDEPLRDGMVLCARRRVAARVIMNRNELRVDS